MAIAESPFTPSPVGARARLRDFVNHRRYDMPARQQWLTRIGRLIATLALAFSLTSTGVAQAQSSDAVLEWNRILLTTLATPGATDPTVFFTRPLAVMHVAVFDALNSFDRIYTPYVGLIGVPTGASREAAVAQAAH